MKSFIKITLLSITLTSGILYAGSGHSHNHDGSHGHSHTQTEVTNTEVEKIATQQLIVLAKNTKIEKSWKDSPIIDIQKKKFHHNVEWVVSFTNKEVKDKTKETLYIFVDLYGKVTGANHTGK